MNIVSKIKEKLGHFSPIEEKNSRFILANFDYAAHTAINELAMKMQLDQYREKNSNISDDNSKRLLLGD